VTNKPASEPQASVLLEAFTEASKHLLVYSESEGWACLCGARFDEPEHWSDHIVAWGHRYKSEHPGDKASEREAALTLGRVRGLIAKWRNESGLSSSSDQLYAVDDAIQACADQLEALLAAPERLEMTETDLERVRAVLAEHSCTVAIWSHPQVKTKCKCGWERLHVLADADRTWLLWVEHFLALLAAPRAENP